MCGPARIEARLRDAARPRPPCGDHLGAMLAALVAEEELLIAPLADPIPNLVERVEDDVDIGPVGGARDDQRNPFDLRLRGGLAVVLLEQLPGLEDSPGLLRPDTRARARGWDEGMAGLNLVAFRRSFGHRLDRADDFPKLQEANLGLFQRGLRDLRSVVRFCECSDLIGGAVKLLAEGDLATLQDRGEPVRQRFDLGLEPGTPQLAEQGLESLPDDAVLEQVILRDRQDRALPFSVSP